MIYTYHHDLFSHNSILPYTQEIYCFALLPVRYCTKF